MRTQYIKERKIEFQSSKRNWSYAALWVLGTQCRSSARAMNDLNCRVIFLAFFVGFLYRVKLGIMN